VFDLNTELLEDIITKSDYEKLIPVVRASYQLVPMDAYGLTQVALSVNEMLGKPLFTDMAYSMLVQNFSIVTRMVQDSAMHHA
jgi:hypothetical protein